MKSYIRHLQDPSDSLTVSIAESEELGTRDRRLREGKRKVLVRSLSDPLLPVMGDARQRQPIRRGRKRPTRGLQRNSSFDGELKCEGLSCSINAHKPARRLSIDNKTNTSTMTLTSAIREQYNATRPVRRGSLEQSKALSFPDLLDESATSAKLTLPEPPKRFLRTSQKNLLFRAQILCNALDDMGLFDDEDESHALALSRMPLSPKLLGNNLSLSRSVH